MRKSLLLAAAAASLLASSSAPAFAYIQSFHSDPCREERHEAARNGTVAGGLIGALVGSQIAGRGSHTEGAIIGGTVGAVAGHQIGAHTVQCEAYPEGRREHRGCHWVSDTYRGRTEAYEVCRGRDGNWRPMEHAG